MRQVQLRLMKKEIDAAPVVTRMTALTRSALLPGQIEKTKPAIFITYCQRQPCLNDTSITSRVVFVTKAEGRRRKRAEAAL